MSMRSFGRELGRCLTSCRTTQPEQVGAAFSQALDRALTTPKQAASGGMRLADDHPRHARTSADESVSAGDELQIPHLPSM